MPDQIGYFASLKNAAGKVFTYLASITLTGTDGKIITCTQDTSLDEAVAMSSKAPKASPTFTGQVSITGASRMRATRATAQSVGSSAQTIVQYNTETFDNLDEYDNATNYRFTAKEAGYYSISASLLSASVAWDAGEIWQISVCKNGVLNAQGTRTQADAAITTYMQSQINDMIYLAVNDYIDIRVFHNQGAAVNTYNDATYNYFSVHRLS